MKRTTLCYIKHDGAYLMLYRNAKPDDPNQAKWLGIGGKIEDGESPSDCNAREVYEETGLRLESAIFHGVIKFRSDEWEDEDMYLFSAEIEAPAHPMLPACDEGELAWISEDELLNLPMWEGDRAFLTKLMAGEREISMTLRYTGDTCTVEEDEMVDINSSYSTEELFNNNLKLLRRTFPWDGDALCRIAAEILCDTGVSPSMLKECERLIKSECGIFSVFRGHIKLPLICFMLEEDNPLEFLRKVIETYEHLKAGSDANADKLALSAIIYVRDGRSEEISTETNPIYRRIAEVLDAAERAKFI